MATISITAPALNSNFFISTAPAMPAISLQAAVQGSAQANPTYTWSFSLDYSDFITVPGSIRRNVRTKTYPKMAKVTGNPITVPFTALMCGRLTVTVEATVDGRALSATRNDILIGGANPTADDLKTAVSQSIIRKMVRQESGGNQFSDTGRRGWVATAINPNWSGDNLRGVGLGQLTVPAPSDDDIWNWRVNAADLQTIFAQKRTPAATLHARIAASSRFVSEVRALADWRAAENLPALQVKLPPLSSDQQDCEGLRAYNGFGYQIAGQYLSYVHEFEPAMTVLTSATRKYSSGRPLQSPPLLYVDANGNASWSQISGAERVRRFGGRRPGEPNYVALVLAQPD